MQLAIATRAGKRVTGNEVASSSSVPAKKSRNIIQLEKDLALSSSSEEDDRDVKINCSVISSSSWE